MRTFLKRNVFFGTRATLSPIRYEGGQFDFGVLKVKSSKLEKIPFIIPIFIMIRTYKEQKLAVERG